MYIIRSEDVLNVFERSIYVLCPGGTTFILLFDGSLKYKGKKNLLENTLMKSAYKEYIT